MKPLEEQKIDNEREEDIALLDRFDKIMINTTRRQKYQWLAQELSRAEQRGYAKGKEEERKRILEHNPISGTVQAALELGAEEERTRIREVIKAGKKEMEPSLEGSDGRDIETYNKVIDDVLEALEEQKEESHD